MSDLLLIAIEAALQAGNAILEIYGHENFNIEIKEDQTPLTIADRRSNDIILRYLELTEIPVLSEESLHQPWSERKEWDRCWIVDPLDGTKEFIKRNGEFTVNIALAESGKPVAGVVYAPVTGEIYWADEHSGAFKATVIQREYNHSPASEIISSGTKLGNRDNDNKTFIAVASRSHQNQETEQFLKNLRSKHPDLITISRGSSLKICMVAEGKANWYPRFAPTMEWDTAAGQAIAVAAGCRMYDPSTSQPLIYNKESLKNPWFVVERNIYQSSGTI